jgi:hypothetical protein
MTDEEVRQALGVSVEIQAGPGSWKYQMVVSSAIIGVPCTAVLLFDAGRRLGSTVLWVRDPNAVVYGDLARFLARELGPAALLERLGPSSSGNTLERIFWRLPRTLVSIVRSVNTDGETISIVYESPGSSGRP